MSVRGAMQGAGGGRATMSYPQHCLGATDLWKIITFLGQRLTEEERAGPFLPSGPICRRQKILPAKEKLKYLVFHFMEKRLISI